MVLTARVWHVKNAAAAIISTANKPGMIRKYFHMLSLESEGAGLVGLELLLNLLILPCTAETRGGEAAGPGKCFFVAVGIAGNVPLLLEVGRAMT